MSIQSCTFFLLASSVSYVQAQTVEPENSTTGRIVAGCIVAGFFAVLLLLSLFIILAGRRRRSRIVVQGPTTNQHESKPVPWGRSHPVQQNPMPTTSYGPQRMAQTSAPPVRSDLAFSNAHYYSQGVPPPPAYVKDPNVNGGYSAQPNGNATEGQKTNDIPYSPPPFPPTAHVNGQGNTFVGGFRS